MTSALEIHEDTQSNLSVWRDPYAWVDPVSEAEEWALRYAEIRQDSDAEMRDVRDMHRQEIAHMAGIQQGLMKVISDYASTLNQPPMFIPKDPA